MNGVWIQTGSQIFLFSFTTGRGVYTMAQLEKGSPSKHLAVGLHFELSKTISANLYVFLT